MTPDYLIELAQRRPLVLGSGSPRRVQLLRSTGVQFRQAISHIEEQHLPGENPFDFAARMAQEKALDIITRCHESEIVLSGDTVVVLEDTILGKPGNEQEAVRILQSLSGRQHIVCTALALAGGGQMLRAGCEKTKVFFNEVSRERINEYIASGEPMDKAGAYGIQGMGAFLVDRIEGNLDNVVGLPLTLLNTLAEGVLSLV